MGLRCLVALSCCIVHSLVIGSIENDVASISISNLHNGVVTESLEQLLQLMEIPHDHSLSSIVRETQKRWIRSAGKERWEIADIESEKKQQILALAEKMGFFSAITPKEEYYNYCVILGATVFRMQKRIESLIHLWQQGIRFDQIVILTAERKLDARVETLADICKTEGEAARLLWQLAPLKEGLEHLPVMFIEVPMISTPQGMRRANTADTFSAWLKTRPQQGNVLLISNQPYCLYQDAVARNALPSSFIIETVGDGVVQSQLENGAVILDTIARWLYAHEQLHLKK